MKSDSLYCLSYAKAKLLKISFPVNGLRDAFDFIFVYYRTVYNGVQCNKCFFFCCRLDTERYLVHLNTFFGTNTMQRWLTELFSPPPPPPLPPAGHAREPVEQPLYRNRWLMSFSSPRAPCIRSPALYSLYLVAPSVFYFYCTALNNGPPHPIEPGVYYVAVPTLPRGHKDVMVKNAGSNKSHWKHKNQSYCRYTSLGGGRFYIAALKK